MKGEWMPGQEHNEKVLANDSWEDLVISILSVNQYSLEYTYRSIDRLRSEGLFEPRHLMNWDQNEIVERLKSAGCDRGPFMTNLFALRLANLGALITGKGFECCNKVISGSDTRAVEELLLPVNGVGPKVIANFCFLRDIAKK
jgi:endonuclease III-like uncharacterized protein